MVQKGAYPRYQPEQLPPQALYDRLYVQLGAESEHRTQSFEECQPVSRDFSGMTTRHSIYAVRHQIPGTLIHWEGSEP